MSKKTRKVRKNNKNNKTKYRGGSKGKGKGKISLFENTVKALASLRTNLIPINDENTQYHNNPKNKPKHNSKKIYP